MATTALSSRFDLLDSVDDLGSAVGSADGSDFGSGSELGSGSDFGSGSGSEVGSADGSAVGSEVGSGSATGSTSPNSLMIGKLRQDAVK